MSTVADEFLSWASDPSRTLEERYGIVRLIEAVCERYHTGPDKQRLSVEDSIRQREDRRYNAAYVPVIEPDRLHITADLLPKVTELAFHNFGLDRPMGDISFLRFVPRLTSLTLEGLEVESLDVLRHLPGLSYFRTIHADRVEDFTALASCRKLQHLSLYTRHPWPDFTGLETLPLLDTLDIHITLRALIEIPSLPAMRWLSLEDHAGYSMNGCLRDFHQLPDMPRLEQLCIRSLYRLDGIERFPRLRCLNVMGFFRTLAPVARAASLTHLRIVNDELRDVAAVAAAPRLHHFALKSIRPQDWTVLMESTTLREVFADGCSTPQPDLDTLRFVLPPRSDVFAAPAPRPLPPLRLLAYDAHEKDPARLPADDHYSAAGPDGWEGCHYMRQSESLWLADLLEESFRAAGLLGVPGVRLNACSSRNRRGSHLFLSTPSVSHRSSTIQLLKVQAISRLREVVAAIRAVLCQTRSSTHVSLILKTEPDADEWDEDWRDSDDTPQERAMEHLREEQERERAQERLKLFLADQHRLALLREQGTAPSPGDIGPRRLPPAAPLPPLIQPPAGPADRSADDTEDEKSFFDTGDGGLAEAESGQDDDEEKWLAPVEISDPNVNWNGLCLYLTVTESAVWCPSYCGDIESASYLLDLPIETPPGSTSEEA